MTVKNLTDVRYFTFTLHTTIGVIIHVLQIALVVQFIASHIMDNVKMVLLY